MAGRCLRLQSLVRHSHLLFRAKQGGGAASNPAVLLWYGMNKECGTLQNHRMIWVGRDLTDHLAPTPPAMGRDTFHWTRLLKAPSSLALNTAREGEATPALGNLFQCLTALTVLSSSCSAVAASVNVAPKFSCTCVGQT